MKALFVPFAHSVFGTIPLTGKMAGELRSELKSGNSDAARAALNVYFDNASEKARAEKDSVDWARGFFEVRTLTDLEDIRGTVVTKVHKATTLPKSVRAELAKGQDKVVYSVVLDGYKSFAVFNSKSNPWGARGTLFGPKGERLGRVKTRTELDPWEFEHSPSQAEDDGEYKAGRMKTHFGRHP